MMGTIYGNFTAKQLRLSCYILAFTVITAFIIDNSIIRSLLSYDNYIIIKVLYWSAASAVILFFLPNTGQAGKLKFSGHFSFWAFNCALIYIAILITAGVIAGFGASPYDHSLKGILYNIVTVGPVLAALELIRSYLVNGLFKKEKYLAFLLIAILMILPYIRISTLIQITDLVELSVWVCEDFGPAFCLSMTATYLCFLGGPLPAIIYIAVISGFRWFSPVLPDLPWLVTGLIGILIPVFQLTFISGVYLTMNKTIKAHKSPKESFIGWMATCLSTVALLWFAVGVFPVYPSVIATGSMEPVIFPGDLILIDKITTVEEVKALKEGDIIHFRRDDMMICHRIDKIIEKEGIPYFITKGDNNPREDAMPVSAESLKGSIIKVVPKVGWPSLIFKLAGNRSTEPVQL